MNTPNLTTAEWMVLEHDWDTDVVQLARTTEDDYGIHQDQTRKKVIAGTTDTIEVPMNQLPDIPFEKTLYVLHLGYGGSTLISRLLDVKGKLISNVEAIPHCRGRLEGYEKLASMFSRSFNGEVHVVKTIPLEIDCLDMYRDRNEENVCILMHQTLEEFLIACFNVDSDRTRKAVLNMSSYVGRDPIDHTNHELAVRLFIDYWTSMMSKYKESMLRDNTRLIGLRSSDFYEDTVGYTELLASLVGVELTAVDLERAHRKLKVHSKWGTAFNEQDRINQKNEAYQVVKPYIDKYQEEIDSLNEEYKFIEDHLLKL